MSSADAMRTLLGLKESGKPGRLVVWDTEEVSVGRSPENDLVLDDTDTSRRHALFTVGHTGYEVQDLGTANGTRVNKEAISAPRALENKDVVEIGEVQITFIQTRKDPASLGLEVVYSSQLKAFAGAAAADPGATTLGLSDAAPSSFEVGRVGDYGFDGSGDRVDPEAATVAPKDLDLEFAEFAPAGSQAEAGSARLSLQLELEGLSPDLHRLLQALIGKDVELPPLRIRIKSE